jgi:hypothetical protein
MSLWRKETNFSSPKYHFSIKTSKLELVVGDMAKERTINPFCSRREQATATYRKEEIVREVTTIKAMYIAFL